MIMKKLFFLFFLFLIPLVLFAQGDVPDVPETVSDILDDPGRFMKQLAGIAGLTIFVVGNLVLWFKLETKWVKVVVAAVVGLALSLLTNLIDYGLFADSAWLDTLVWGTGIGAVAGGLTDIPTMKIIVNILLSLVRLKKPTD